MDFSDLDQYRYVLPPERIRKQALEPRDCSRLFVYNTETDTITESVFLELAQFLPEKAILVLNDTRVLPVRLWLRKETGGKIEVFVLMNECGEDEKRSGTHIPVLVDRKTSVGQSLFFPNGDRFEVTGQEENRFFVTVHSKRSLEELLEAYGTTPLPHYLEGEMRDEKELRKRYQTIFAEKGSSVAAPTAALHFTDRVFASLSEKEIEQVRVTLNVGLGTFAPLTEEHFATKKLHKESILVSREVSERLSLAKRSNRPIIAVGTTALRTLESVVSEDGFREYSGITELFIYPPHHFRGADMLLTNFHLPGSSLMLLVDAFLKDKGAKRGIVELYEEAIRRKFDFYSFGDSMLIR